MPNNGNGNIKATFDLPPDELLSGIMAMGTRQTLPETAAQLVPTEQPAALETVPGVGGIPQPRTPAITAPATPGGLPAIAVPPVASTAPGPVSDPTLNALAPGAFPSQPTPEQALGQIPTAQQQPTKEGAAPPAPLTRGQRFLHMLGQIGGGALSALAPGVAAQIPETPLGKIVAQNRALQQQKLATENLQAQAQMEEARAKALTAGPLAQAQVDELEARGVLTREQAAQLRDKTNVVLPNGMILPMDAKDAERYYQNLATVQGKRDVAGITGQFGLEKTAAQQAGATERTGMQQAGATQRTGMQQAGAWQRELGREATQKEVTQMRDDTSKLVASERIQAADDPNKLTAQMKTMKQQAQAVLPQLDQALQETDQVKDLLGPAAGRWNSFLQGTLGATDPNLARYAHYSDEIAFVSTAITLAHARGRMSDQLFDHFQKMFDAGRQSPENMKQALTVAKEWMTSYANLGEGTRSGGTTPTPAAPSASAATSKGKDPFSQFGGVAHQ